MAYFKRQVYSQANPERHRGLSMRRAGERTAYEWGPIIEGKARRSRNILFSQCSQAEGEGEFECFVLS